MRFLGLGTRKPKLGTRDPLQGRFWVEILENIVYFASWGTFLGIQTGRSAGKCCIVFSLGAPRLKWLALTHFCFFPGVLRLKCFAFAHSHALPGFPLWCVCSSVCLLEPCSCCVWWLICCASAAVFGFLNTKEPS